MAKIRGSKNGKLKFYKEQLEEGLRNPEILTEYVKGVITAIEKEIERSTKTNKTNC